MLDSAPMYAGFSTFVRRNPQVDALMRKFTCFLFIAAFLGQGTSQTTTLTNTAALSKTFTRPVESWLQEPGERIDKKRSQLERRFLIHLATDQAEFIRGAGRFRIKDFRWALPLAGATGLTLATDPEASRNLAGSDPNRWETSSTISDAGLATMGALAGGAYLWGAVTHDPKKRETGVLAIEAATGALIDNEALKQIFRRDRPIVGAGRGYFFNSPAKFPSDSSVVSGHSMLSWSIASVIAHEYPGWLTQTAVYSLAALTSATRVSAKKHFPSDVLLGAAAGWYIGHQVYRAHHDPELGGMDIGTIVNEPVADPLHRSLGSTYVPLDSWVYEAMDRLAGMGVLSSNLSSLRPWTRIECARLVQEAESSLLRLEAPEQSSAAQITRELRAEFEHEYQILDGKENVTAAVESLYARVQGISGPPLTDGYHFGQTIYNDFGRPYAEGANFVSGGSAYASKGRWSVYFRGEMQHAPSGPNLPLGARTTIAALEGTTLDPRGQINEINRGRVLDAYAALTLRKWQFSFGKQSMWWGPNHEGSMNYSNNAEPVNMFRVATVQSIELPWFFKYLGGTRGEAFFGQLEGHRFIRTSTGGLFGPNLSKQPYIEGLKVAFKPTENFEFGVSITSIWGGSGVPITLRTFRRSLSAGNAIPGQPLDPGDRRTGFDFKYRIPGLRNWLTLYNDSMSEDEFNPIGYPRRSSHAPGIYLSHVPGLEKLDIRAEGYYTDLPGLRTTPGTWYFNNHYLSGYTNEGNILGHPVGRQGRGYTLTSTYWIAPQKTATLGFRHAKIGDPFLQGGYIDDYFARTNWKFSEKWNVRATLQYEQWRFPLLAPARKANVTVSFELIYKPRWKLR
jgi:membrane-associated phospholipid phosphatase